jgi:hypothetical protein
MPTLLVDSGDVGNVPSPEPAFEALECVVGQWSLEVFCDPDLPGVSPGYAGDGLSLRRSELQESVT